MKVESPIHEVSVTVPLAGEGELSLPPRKIEVSLRSPRDAASANALARIRDGLRERHTQLDCRRHVETYADAVRWLLERVHAAAGSQKAGRELRIRPSP
jgi:hypothetical protein